MSETAYEWKPVDFRTKEEWQEERNRLSEDYADKAEGFLPTPVTQVAGTGPQELQQVLAQRQAAMQGYDAPQLAAMRASMAGNQQAAQQQRERALQAALAKQGIRGGSAAALQAQMGLRAQQEQAQAETGLMLAQEQRQREALGEYEGTVTDAYQRAQEQAFQESAAKLAMEQLAQADYIAQMGKESEDLYSTEMADATKEAGGCFSIAIISAAGLAASMSDAKAADLNALRMLRDTQTTVEQRRGYYMVSESVDGILKSSPVARSVGKALVVAPAVTYAKTGGFWSGVVTKFWLKVFALVAPKTPFIRSNGEVV